MTVDTAQVGARTVDLVVTDLDGSLWDGEARMHPATREALHELDRRALPWIVATGRRRRSTRDALAGYDLAPSAVLLDGAMGRDLATGDWFHRAAFTAEECLVVLETFAGLGLSPALYQDTDHVDFVVAEDTSTHPGHVARAGAWCRVGDLHEAVAGGDVFAFSVVGCDTRRLAEATAVLDATGVARATVTPAFTFGGGTLTVRATTTSKWEGVAAFCARQDLDQRRVLAVGDGENDLELLRGAAVACVVADACDAALAEADHVIPPAADGGWARILDLLGP